jgi:hypothetical protein
MCFVGIDPSGLVSGTYYNGGGAVDIDALKVLAYRTKCECCVVCAFRCGWPFVEYNHTALC